jgi:uncharacterized protein YyaL (SSP411 family)
MITAFAKGYQVLRDEKYLNAANRSADFVRKNLYDAKEQILIRAWREGAVDIEGFAEDYAYLIRGLIDLYESSFDTAQLEWATALQKQDSLFGTTRTAVTQLQRQGSERSPAGEGRLRWAEPSPNTISAINLLRLSHLLGNST